MECSFHLFFIFLPIFIGDYIKGYIFRVVVKKQQYELGSDITRYCVVSCSAFSRTKIHSWKTLLLRHRSIYSMLNVTLVQNTWKRKMHFGTFFAMSSGGVCDIRFELIHKNRWCMPDAWPHLIVRCWTSRSVCLILAGMQSLEVRSQTSWKLPKN